MRARGLCLLLVVTLSGLLTGTAFADDTLRIATFKIDATPPLGTPLCMGAIEPAKEIVDPLSASGIILLTNDAPIVVCTVDWIGIANDGHEAWRKALAEACGTTPERVAVHAVHQHDAPDCDFTAAALLAPYNLSQQMFNTQFARDTIRKAAAAAGAAIKSPLDVTHVGIGKGLVEKVASNRRVLGPDGKVQYIRWSSTREEGAINAPEGTIDPYVWLVSFWNGDKPLVSITHYATHPQSHYGKGGVSCDFPGIAREMREEALPDVAHLHFNGAGGNVTAGKYNTGEPALRPVLAKRLAAGMKLAWEATEKFPVSSADVSWKVEPVLLPVRDIFQRDALQAIVSNKDLDRRQRIGAAADLAFVDRMEKGHPILINGLKVGPARVVYMPGELFVEYQLAAQGMRPGEFVAMAAYGDYGPGYIGMEISYTQGGYETGPASRTAPSVEGVLMEAMRKVLED